MAGERHFQTNFSAGELDEALQERVDLKSYSAGLNTARNVNVSKRGTLVSRAGRKYLRPANGEEGVADSIGEVVLSPLKDGRFIEWGTYDFFGTVKRYTIVHDSNQEYQYSDGSDLAITTETYDKFKTHYINDSQILAISNDLHGRVFNIDLLPNLVTLEQSSLLGKVAENFYNFLTSIPAFGTTNGNGYLVKYTIYEVLTRKDGDGLENRGYSFSSASLKLPVAAGEINEFNFTAPTGEVREVRIYRKPVNGGVPGYIGSAYPTTGTPDTFQFTDYGQEADFANTPPVNVLDDLDTINDAGIIASTMYQQRLLVAVGDKIYASYTDIPRHFKRNFPYDDVSGLAFKPSSSQGSDVIHMVDYNGLLIFTKSGLYFHTGVLGPNNLVCTYQGPWRVDEDLQPIEIPGAVLFVDSSTNSVRELVYNEGTQRLIAPEVSVFSDHLFNENRVTSWAFQDGELPLLHATFSDGTYATFTYQQEHNMRAWTRCDSANDIVQVIAVPNETGGRFESDIIFLTQDSSGNYHIESSVPRYLKPQELVSNPEADKGPVAAAMDSMVSWSHLILDDLTDDDMVLTPVTPSVWDGDLTLSVTDDAIFPDPGLGTVGTFFKWFNPTDRTEILLEVTARTDDNTITVTPSREFPSSYATNPRLYEAKTNFTGLDHMEGESVAVLADGYVIASPNNNIENYDTYTVTSGEIDLDEPRCIVHIGRPRTCDIQTLAITEIGEGRALSRTRLESFTCNRVFVRVKDTRGLYVGNRFPADDKVEGNDVTGTNQVSLDGFTSYDVNYENENEVVGNRYDQPYTRTVEVTTPGDFDGKGQICIRQVDPVHFEILSITPDIELIGIGG